MKTIIYCIISTFCITIFLFSTVSCEKDEPVTPAVVSTIPTVTTYDASSITHNSISSGGNVTSDGGSTLISKGVCWSTSPNPLLVTNYTSEGSSVDSFISSVVGLLPNTTYYLRAYAVNSVGTSYGNEISFTTTAAPLTIGSLYQGGMIAYFLQSGDPGYDPNVQHGLIVSRGDVAKWLGWGCNGTLISGADGTAIGTGYQNTLDIITTCTYGAAKICNNSNDGYDDWYLPSKDELNILFINKDLTIGLGYHSGYYWSSSEIDQNKAWAQNFTTGNFAPTAKDSVPFVRAMRRF